ncbi:MAG: portal protein [Clostridium sp.]
MLYIECYFRDYELMEVEDLEENTKKKIMKYLRGSRVIIAGDILLYDGENPYKDGSFPFREWQCYKQPNKFWAISEVEQLLSMQRKICCIYDDIIENAHLMGNPMWIMDKNCGVAENSLSNRKGLIVRKNPGTDVRRNTPLPYLAIFKTC